MLELLKQRRVWVMALTLIIGVLSLFNVEWGLDVEGTSDTIVNVVTIGGAFLSAVLALWSYVKPKPKA
jgi:hypothetical protein